MEHSVIRNVCERLQILPTGAPAHCADALFATLTGPIDSAVLSGICQLMIEGTENDFSTGNDSWESAAAGLLSILIQAELFASPTNVCDFRRLYALFAPLSQAALPGLVTATVVASTANGHDLNYLTEVALRYDVENMPPDTWNSLKFVLVNKLFEFQTNLPKLLEILS